MAHALGSVATALLYQRHGRRPPKPGPARAAAPSAILFEREYAKRLTAIVRAWSDHVETIVRGELRADALDDDLLAAWRALVRASGLESWLRRNAKDVSGRNARYVERVANIPVGSAVPQGVLEEFLQDNVGLITNMADRQIQQIADIVRPAQAGGQRWEEIADQIQQRLGVSVNRARLIARDQANKFNAAMAENTQTAAGIEEYEWTTANDFAVRGRPGGEYEDSKENHWKLHGKIFRWDSPPLIPGTSERAHPGQRIQCRCTARPVVRDLFPQRAAPERPAEIIAQERRLGYGVPAAGPARVSRAQAEASMFEVNPGTVIHGALPTKPGVYTVRTATLATAQRPEGLAPTNREQGIHEGIARGVKFKPIEVTALPGGRLEVPDGNNRLAAARTRREAFVRVRLGRG